MKVKNAEKVLDEINEKLEGNEKELTLISTTNLKYKPVNEFVILFADSLFLTIDEYDLNATDIKVILKIISYAQYGNLLQFSKKTLAKDCGLKLPNLYRSLKKLHDTSLLITVRENVYLNPQIIAKGALKKFAEAEKIDGEIENLIEIGAKKMKEKLGIEPNIETKEMKQNRSRNDEISQLLSK